MNLLLLYLIPIENITNKANGKIYHGGGLSIYTKGFHIQMMAKNVTYAHLIAIKTVNI
jgi:hypothetical protein